MQQSADFIKDKLISPILKSLKEMNNHDDFTEDFVATTLESPTDTSKGDYAFPCFKLAKALRNAPPKIAAELVEIINKQDLFAIEKVELAGGYINFFIDTNQLSSQFLNDIKSTNYFQLPQVENEKVMIEYSQPNTHKEFHVGHGRNVCLGDSITRLYRYNGFNTVPVNYIGDEGAHIAKCLYAVRKSEEKIPETKRAQWLGQKYVEAGRILADANEEEKKEIEKELSFILAEIESKKGEIFELWKETKQYCMDDFNDIYAWLDVKFDHFFFESDVSEPSQKIVDEYLEKGVFKIDQGAVGIDMSDDKLGFMMVRKSDGNGLYITKDIALAKVKFDEFNITNNIYVVANEQDYHFKQLFNFFKLAGFEHADQCFHLSYGMVVRPDGKMSSRTGNSFTFFDLVTVIEEELQKYMEKYKDEWSADQINQTIQRLAVGAIKYGMLSTDPNKEIVFEPENWVRFDGNSGPYLTYSYARSRSILEKANDKGLSPDYNSFENLTDESEKALVKFMYKFNSTAISAQKLRKPSIMCHYLFELCKVFNQFYVKVPILKDENKAAVQTRLALIESFGDVLKQGLNLIGITPVEKM